MWLYKTRREEVFLIVMECMGCNEMGIFAMVEEWMDVEQYVYILEDNLLFSIENSTISEESIIFQQNNNPENSSKRAQNWFKSQGIMTGKHSY